MERGIPTPSCGSRCSECGVYYKHEDERCPQCGNPKPAMAHRDWKPNQLPEALKVLPLAPPGNPQKFRVRT